MTLEERAAVLDEDIITVYPKGTRTYCCHFEDKALSISSAVYYTMDKWRETYGEFNSYEDLFITIGFATGVVIIEVSDRMKDV